MKLRAGFSTAISAMVSSAAVPLRVRRFGAFNTRTPGCRRSVLWSMICGTGRKFGGTSAKKPSISIEGVKAAGFGGIRVFWPFTVGPRRCCPISAESAGRVRRSTLPGTIFGRRSAATASNTRTAAMATFGKPRPGFRGTASGVDGAFAEVAIVSTSCLTWLAC